MNRDVIRLYFLTKKSKQSVRREHDRLFLSKYPNLATRIREHNLADKKRSISVNRLLSAVELPTIKMEVKQQPPIDKIPLEGADNVSVNVNSKIREKLQHLQRNFGCVLLEFRGVEPRHYPPIAKASIKPDVLTLIT